VHKTPELTQKGGKCGKMFEEKLKIKRDQFLRKRGGTAKIIDVSCMKCGKLVFVYQKDGPGWLKRCYLNRILEPEEFSKLQKDKTIQEPKDLKNLVCTCGQVLGSPTKFKDDRLAFSLIRSKFKRSNHKEVK
jgi:hypothetical protein